MKPEYQDAIERIDADRKRWMKTELMVDCQISGGMAETLIDEYFGKVEPAPTFWIAKSRLDRILSKEIDWPHVYTTDQSEHFECVPLFISAQTPAPAPHLVGDAFTHRLVENTFSWAMEGCHYLDPRSMGRLIEATKAGLKPEDAATWRSDLPEIMAKRARLLREHWASFCDADPFPGSDVFADRMEAAGLIELVPVTKEALEDNFAAERGIEPGGMMYRLTDAGRAALTTEGQPDA